MAEMAAVSTRIYELVQSISSVEAGISALDTRLKEGNTEYEQQMQIMQEKHEAAIRHENQQFLDEFDARASMTIHFTAAAHDACIQTLLKQQDNVLEPEFITYRQDLLTIADAELVRLEETFVRTEKSKLDGVLKQEEQAYLKRVERAVNAHEERLRRLDHHED